MKSCKTITVFTAGLEGVNEVKNRKRPDCSGLPMRTKRLNHRSWPRYHELSSDAALRTTPCFTHGNPHFCINDLSNLLDPPLPASHQFWLQAGAGLYTLRMHALSK